MKRHKFLEIKVYDVEIAFHGTGMKTER